MQKLFKSLLMGLLWWVSASLCLIFSLGVVSEYEAQKIREIEERPVTDWVEYKRIEPSEKVYMVGESIFFRSHANFKKSYYTEWEDILFCEVPWRDGFVYYSVYNSSNPNPVVSNNVKVGKFWRYGGEVPYFETRCFLKSNTIMTDRNNGVVKKHPTIESPVFKITEEADGN